MNLIHCIRNSKNQTASAYLSHRELLNKTADEMIEMLKDRKGVDWYEFEDEKKYGRIVRKIDCLDSIVNRKTGESSIVNRTKWIVEPGMNLTAPENRETLKKF